MSKTYDEIQGEINGYKQLLEQTDYKCLKYAEGSMSAADFAPIHAQRDEWREAINELEEQLEPTEAVEE